MSKDLTGKHVAILATDGFEQSELESPKNALEKAGAEVKVVSLKSGTIRGWKDNNWGSKIKVDMTLEEANPSEFDALILPGGVTNPDKLRNDNLAVAFVKSFMDEGKPVGAICHGPWTLINAESVKGREMTSYASIKIDLENAGARWVDREVVTDNGLVTSRTPDDLPAFNAKIIEEILEGQHEPKKFYAEDEAAIAVF